jgi:hypothetical protein
MGSFSKLKYLTTCLKEKSHNVHFTLESWWAAEPELEFVKVMERNKC